MAETKRQQAIVLVKDSQSIAELGATSSFIQQARNVASKYLTPEKLIKIGALAAYRSPDLYKCTIASFANALITAGELGLDCAGITGQGYLIAYGNKNLPKGVKECKFMPGYQGFIELAYRTKQTDFIDSQLVFANDKYKCQLGSNPKIEHEPKLDGDRGPMLFGYGIVILTSSTRPKIEFMTEADLQLIKSRSRSGDSGPWRTDFNEMCRKTLIRRIWKYIPKTPEIHAALEADNADFDSFDVASERASEEINEKMGSEPVDLPKTKKKVESKEVATPETQESTFVWTCTNPKCKHTMTEQPLAKNGKMQCPECLKLTMEGTAQEEQGEGFLKD